VPLTLANPGKELNDLVAARAQALVLVPGDHFLSDLPTEEVQLTAPHRVYVLDFDALPARQLSRARFAGWRYLLMAGDTIVGSAEAIGAERAVSVSGGRFPQATADAIQVLERLPEVQTGDFELRLLRLNALYLTAVWVVGETQIVIPLNPAPSWLEAGRSYNESDFFDTLEQAHAKPFGIQRGTGSQLEEGPPGASE
jgi:hypothetical protein